MNRAAAACFLLLLGTGAAQGQQTRDPRAAPPPAGSSSLSGVVVSDENPPRPLRRARVTLNAPDVPVARTAITEDDGTFKFEGLPAGKYVVAASKEGFVPMAFGARRPTVPGARLTLGDAQHQRDLTIRLPRGAVISGAISAEDGSPLAGLTVAALSYQYVAALGARRVMRSPQPFATTTTDDRGAYRLFGLAAGEYKVSAFLPPGPDAARMGTDVRMHSEADLSKALAAVRDARRVGSGSTSATVSPEPARIVRLAPIYLPGTPMLSAAATVRLAAGEERTGLDFAVHRVPVATVEGFVSPLPQSAAVSVTMFSEHMEADFDGLRSPRGVDEVGRFTFTGVTPGTYTLVARSRARPDDTKGGLFGTATVAVHGDDVTGVSITMAPALTLSGRLVFEGGSTPDADLSKLRVFVPAAVVSGTGVGIGPLEPPTITTDGRFTLRAAPPGAYGTFMRLPGLQAPIGRWWLKSAASRGRELLDAPLEFRESADDVVITFTDRPNEVSGTIRGAGGKLEVDGYVILFSADRTHWFSNSRRVVALKPESGGGYRIRNVPPGDYFIAATADVAQFEWFDPGFLSQFAQRATRVRVGAEKTNADLTWIY